MCYCCNRMFVANIFRGLRQLTQYRMQICKNMLLVFPKYIWLEYFPNQFDHFLSMHFDIPRLAFSNCTLPDCQIHIEYRVGFCLVSNRRWHINAPMNKFSVGSKAIGTVGFLTFRPIQYIYTVVLETLRSWNLFFMSWSHNPGPLKWLAFSNCWIKRDAVDSRREDA